MFHKYQLDDLATLVAFAYTHRLLEEQPMTVYGITISYNKEHRQLRASHQRSAVLCSTNLFNLHGEIRDMLARVSGSTVTAKYNP